MLPSQLCRLECLNFETVTKEFSGPEMFEKPTIILKNQICPNTE
jgi:hypothetical protein